MNKYIFAVKNPFSISIPIRKQFFSLLLLFCQFSFIHAQEDHMFPKGEIKGPFVWKSNVYPGTERNYWIYVPQQYDPQKPACVMVVQDGLSRAAGWNLTAVMDSLLDLKKIPVTIGVFVDHGKVISSQKDAYPRYNRSFEYDAMGDRYATFLLDEILPEVSRSYNLSENPDDRAIAGASSGAIAAFNVAWERPDAFRRVLSTIGSYVGLRGAEEFPKLIRITEPKPIRVFLEDGSNDLNIYAGGWWTANQSMLSALTWAGYEVNHVWGQGGHNSEHAVKILPEALVWLWKDYPKSVEMHPERTQRRMELAVPEESWDEVSTNELIAGKLAINNAGEVYFTSQNSVYKIDNTGKQRLFASLKGTAGGLSFSKDGQLYVADLVENKIVTIAENGNTKDLVKNVHADFITVSDKGIYFSETDQNRIGFYGFSKKKVQYFALHGNPSGLAISAEQTFLNIGISNGLFAYSFKILDDGNLDFGQDYVHYHKPYGSPLPHTQGITVDAENNIYSATAFGVQVSDQLGRINFIFSKVAEDATDVKLGGDDFNILYLSSNGKLYRRKVNARGILSWQPPVTPPEPGL